MVTFEKARQIAESEIVRQKSANDDSLIIVDSEITEKEYAWIFPYTSKTYLETGDINYAVGGNAPLFISKLDGKISTYRTGLSIQGMIDEHEEKNKLWTLFLAEYTLDANSMLLLKAILGWTQENLSEFKRRKDKVVGDGSKTRLSQIQSLLILNGIKTKLTLTRIIT